MYQFYLASSFQVSLEEISDFLRINNAVVGTSDVSYLTIEQLEKISTDNTLFAVSINEDKLEAFCIAFISQERYAHVTFLCVRPSLRGTGFTKHFADSFRAAAKKDFDVKGYSYFRIAKEHHLSDDEYIFQVIPWIIKKPVSQADDNVSEGIVLPGYENFTAYMLHSSDQQNDWDTKDPLAVFIFFEYTSLTHGLVNALVHAIGPLKEIRRIGLSLITGSNQFNYEVGELGEYYTQPLSTFSTIPLEKLRFLY